MPAAEAMEFDVLTQQFRSGMWSKPTALWLGLLLATPEDEGGLVEVSAPEYTRVARHPNDTSWLLAADGSVYNAGLILFASPLVDWSLVKAVGAWDAEAGGTLRAYQNLEAAKNVIANGPALIFQPGALIWKMNDLTA